jgi:hypothetical protein
VLELRVDGAAEAALGRLRADGVADGYAFAVGSTLTLPLRDGTASDLVARVASYGITTSAVTTRRPTLDDVYLRLTGGRITADAGA